MRLGPGCQHHMQYKDRYPETLENLLHYSAGSKLQHPLLRRICKLHVSRPGQVLITLLADGEEATRNVGIVSDFLLESNLGAFPPRICFLTPSSSLFMVAAKACHSEAALQGMCASASRNLFRPDLRCCFYVLFSLDRRYWVRCICTTYDCLTSRNFAAAIPPMAGSVLVAARHVRLL